MNHWRALWKINCVSVYLRLQLSLAAVVIPRHFWWTVWLMTEGGLSTHWTADWWSSKSIKNEPYCQWSVDFVYHHPTLCARFFFENYITELSRIGHMHSSKWSLKMAHNYSHQMQHIIEFQGVNFFCQLCHCKTGTSMHNYGIKSMFCIRINITYKE